MSGGLAVLVMLGADLPTPKSTAGPPAEIAGIWDVERVKVDSEDELHWEYQPDDPQLVGRTLVIGADRVQFHHGKRIGCKQSSWGTRRTTWGFLFAKGFVRPEVGGRSPAPLPKDFDVKVGKDERATTYSLCPASGPHASKFPEDYWVALQAPDHLALHYGNQALLLLRRRAPDAKPAASFECSKAGTPTEKTICGNFDLASWDRSMAVAFKHALERQAPERQAELRKGQKEWLRKRDACDSNVSCIYEEQWRRVDDLIQK